MWVLGGDAVVYASRVADRRHRRESWQTVFKRHVVMACPWDSGWGTRKTYILAIVWRCKPRWLRLSSCFVSPLSFIPFISLFIFFSCLHSFIHCMSQRDFPIVSSFIHCFIDFFCFYFLHCPQLIWSLPISIVNHFFCLHLFISLLIPCPR